MDVKQNMRNIEDVRLERSLAEEMLFPI